MEWVAELTKHGWPAIHWSAVGDPPFTHDLDFGTMLALTHAAGPSVLQVRGQNVLPEDLGPMLFAALRQHDTALASGAWS